MHILTKSKRGEFEILGVIVIILFLNAMAFAGLDLNQQNSFSSVMSNVQASSIIYIIFFVLSLVAILVGKANLVRMFFLGLLAFMTVHLLLNLFYLLTDTHISNNGQAILTDAFLIWTVNVLVFSLWYWIIDRGGPVTRDSDDEQTRYDLVFPQYQSRVPGWENWHPMYLDYLYFSFFTSTTFGPTDTLPLTKRIKMVMITEAATSLVIIGMVASRAMSLVH